MNAAQRLEFEAHLANCPECQEQVGAMITRQLQQLQEPPETAVAEPSEVKADRPGGTARRNVLIGLGAVLVLVAGFALGWWAWQMAHR
jgi:anti-sigma factor RsiW